MLLIVAKQYCATVYLKTVRIQDVETMCIPITHLFQIVLFYVSFIFIIFMLEGVGEGVFIDACEYHMDT